MPLIFWMGAGLAGALGAFLGSQIDDSIDQPPQTASINYPAPFKVGLYAAGALALYWLANKSGALKALK